MLKYEWGSDSDYEDSGIVIATGNASGSEMVGKSRRNGSQARGWLTILGGMCTHLVLGNEYLWGNISSYVISYFHGKGD